jgi:hypothetical protein
VQQSAARTNIGVIVYQCAIVMQRTITMRRA